ncbi:MAG TPA: hypothetical protein VN628_06995 [Vicinamibacterales bacterium]|nr:hypothetical protein [Vicinamibacterales bacterium]
MIKQRGAAIVGVFVLALSAHVFGQWITYPTPNVPRLPDGQPNLKAPAPRQADGKPDFIGFWQPDRQRECTPDLASRVRLAQPCEPGKTVMVQNGPASVPGGLPLQPWAAELAKKRAAELSKDDPHPRCQPDNYPRVYWLPHFTKMFFVPGELLMLNEWNAEFRQVYTDGRSFPEFMHPIYSGYSIGKWDGDTFVVTTKGFRDDQWLDTPGNPITDAATTTERITRPNFGTLNIQVTVDDPKAYTKPFTIDMNMKIMIDTQMIEEFCLENERDSARLSAPTGGK